MNSDMFNITQSHCYMPSVDLHEYACVVTCLFYNSKGTQIRYASYTAFDKLLENSRSGQDI